MQTEPEARKHQEALSEVRAILTAEDFSPEIREALQVVWRHVDGQDKLKLGTKRNYLRYAGVILRKWPVHPTEWTTDTVIEVMEGFRRKEDGSDFSAQYRNTIRVVVRYVLAAFDLKELRRLCEDRSTRLGELMRLQRIPRPVDQFDSTEMITEDHMRALASQMSSDRIRALFWVLWDIGARPDDVKMMTLGDVEFDEDGSGVVLWVPANTKTGKRPTRPRYSLAVLKKYLGDHPYGVRNRDGSFRDPTVALFVNTKGIAWESTRAIGNHLRRAVRLVRGLEKIPDWPYPALPRVVTSQALRINAVNRDMAEGVSIETNAIHHGHSVQVMMEVYRRRDRKELVRREIDALAGIVHDDDRAQSEKWRTCPTCHHQNPPRNEYCSMCGAPITPDAMRKKEEESAARERRIAQTVLDMLLKESKDRGLLA